jgi:hypothetical protein
MEFKEFVSKIYPIVKSSLKNKVADSRYSWITADVAVKKESEVTRGTELRGSEVSTGGTSGDGADAHPYVNEHPDPIELLALDEILELLWPDITYLQYKALVREAGIKTESRIQNEYYGNSTHYSYMTVKVGDLYKAICLRG